MIYLEHSLITKYEIEQLVWDHYAKSSTMYYHFNDFLNVSYLQYYKP